MKETEIRDLVMEHDKSIGIMAQSVEHLAVAVNHTNSQLEDVIKVMGKQNVLNERLNNLETNLKESFDRVHVKVRTLEETQDGEGCTALKLNTVADIGRDVRLKKLESSLTWVVRIIIGALLSGMVGSLFILARG